jgi:hypothetical protein
VDSAALERLLDATPLPSQSPTLAALIARALAADDGADGNLALRAAALQRAGRVEETISLLGNSRGINGPGLEARYAMALFAAGREHEACAVELGAKRGAEARLMSEFCSATDDASAAAPLPRAPTGKQIDVADYISLKLDGKPIKAKLAAKASPELLFRLARDQDVAPELRLAAAERAASLNVIAGYELARAYREAAAKLPEGAKSGPALRARLFASFENAPSANIRAESIGALLASARDQGIEVPVAQALAQAAAGLVEDPQADFFAETGVRIAALAGDEDSAWAWIDTGGERMRSWQLLLAASDPQGPRAEAALAAGIDIALKGGLPPPLLHRLVTVLDALDYEVPMPLWDEASKTPQPQDGDLPPTGALTSLKQAADAGDVGRTMLIAAAVLGPNGAKGAHLIALGDALRALKRVGLDAEARRLGFEALYAHWPMRGKA